MIQINPIEIKMTPTKEKRFWITRIEQSQIDNFVVGVISSMVHDPRFEAAIKDKIRTGVSTTCSVTVESIKISWTPPESKGSSKAKAAVPLQRTWA